MLYHEKRARKKGFKFIVGIDEAGRGPLAGPVVAAAVILGKRFFNEEINDSKKLSEIKRKKAFSEILKSCLVAVGIVENTEIDKINILNATRFAMEQAVRGLGVKPDCLLIDGKIELNLPCHKKCIVKGDSKSLSIAAASIVAKVVRDSIMLLYHKTYPQYDFRYHKGYGTRRHFLALRNFGPCPIHRKSFRPVKDADFRGYLRLSALNKTRIYADKSAVIRVKKET